ncbi:nucleoside recognition protein [Paenibacillus albicereus]|uniref:Nucleoside recognition protein n=1 Tax=Paenibacillus albicereus TaxID=2726185 RepID=A0A6H2GY11_9BACL|nr:nucleoside recognition domain-containing protein [Paenibacillus albicereus]QJC52323.1 nucleoside recognition protein [Paenibacillus albicereus]
MLRTLVTACAAILVVAAIVGGTSEAFQASLSGLSLWWNFVFPALLPFLVLAELMLAFGLVDGLGVLLAPLMRLLRLPGAAGWALVQGWTNGYPAGSSAAAGLVRSGRLTPAQGQRLLALVHSPNPLFVIVVLGAGFLQQPLFGLLLLPLLWAGSLLAAWTTSLFAPRPASESESAATGSDGAQAPGGAVVTDGATGGVPRVAPGTEGASGALPGGAPPSRSKPSAAVRFLHAVEDGRLRDGRSFGKALGDGVSGAVQQLMATGGLIILASVLLRLLQPLLPAAIAGPGLTAAAEAHLGAAALASWHAPEPASLLQAAALAAALGWGGLCALLQAGAAASDGGLRLLPLAAARLLAAAYSGGLALLLWRPLSALGGAAAPAFAGAGGAPAAGWLAEAQRLLQEPGAWSDVLRGALLLQLPLAAALASALLLLSAAAALATRLRRPGRSGA